MIASLPYVAPAHVIAWTLDDFQEAPVDPTARAAFPQLLVEFGEGSVTFAYPDSEGNITTGRGNLLANFGAFCMLDWRAPDGTPATGVQLHAAWLVLQTAALKVKQNGPKKWPGGGFYADLTTLRATQQSIDALIQAELDNFDAILRRDWPGWDDAPAPAQEALMRLIYACGPIRFSPATWPKLHAFWCAQDWGTKLPDGTYTGCASECAIPALDGTEPAANARERDLFLSCTVADTEPPPVTS